MLTNHTRQARRPKHAKRILHHLQQPREPSQRHRHHIPQDRHTSLRRPPSPWRLPMHLPRMLKPSHRKPPPRLRHPRHRHNPKPLQKIHNHLKDNLSDRPSPIKRHLNQIRPIPQLQHKSPWDTLLSRHRQIPRYPLPPNHADPEPLPRQTVNRRGTLPNRPIAKPRESQTTGVNRPLRTHARHLHRRLHQPRTNHQEPLAAGGPLAPGAKRSPSTSTADSSCLTQTIIYLAFSSKTTVNQ